MARNQELDLRNYVFKIFPISFALFGHVPIELSFLFCKFFEKRKNQIFAEVNGGRKLENGLVVLCIYHVNGNKKHIEALSEEINKLKKGKAIHINIKISEI